MKNQITFLAFFIVFSFSSLQAQVTQEWVATYNGGAGYNLDFAYLVKVGNLGNIYVTGNAGGSFSPYITYVTTIKYSSSGIQQWVQRYIGPENANSTFSSMVIDNFENVYVACYAGGSGSDYDYVTIKYNTSGDSLWVARYNGPGINSTDVSHSIAVDASGNIYVTGHSGVTPDFDYATIKYNSSGVQQWVQRYSSSFGQSIASSIAVDASGNVYVTGYSFGSSNSVDYTTIKYNSSGDSLWVSRYNGLANGHDFARALKVDISGNVYVMGNSLGSGVYDYATIKYNSSGIQQWLQRYSSSFGNSYPNSIAIDTLVNTYVTGYSDGSNTGYDYTTIKYNSTGDSQWVVRYNGSGSGNDYANSMKVDGFGNVYVTGTSSRSGVSSDNATIKYNSSGLQQWVQRYDGSGDCGASDLAIDVSGNIYITGRSGVSNNYDYVTIKYSQLTVIQNISSERPNEYSLSQNYPNPFNPITVIRYSLIENLFAKLKIYDVLGNEVATLVNEKQNAGSYSVDFDGSNLSSGIYFYELQTGNFSEVKKMTLLK